MMPEAQALAPAPAAADARPEPAPAATAPVEHSDDVCALPLARRLAAMLDRDPGALQQGEPLPRGWHVMLFNTPTVQSQLRPDGAAHLGVTLPDLGLPRLMLGGRRVRFHGDLPIGAVVRRESRPGEVSLKDGRSGRFALVEIEHRIFVEDATAPAVVEVNEYLLREAAPAEPVRAAEPAQTAEPRSSLAGELETVITPDEAMLFRYSAVTDNPHRIHYDLPYAREAEGYPALLVNGSIPTMFLLELFRRVAGHEPEALDSRNLAPMFCGRPLRLTASPDADGWRLRAFDPSGVTTFEALAR